MQKYLLLAVLAVAAWFVLRVLSARQKLREEVAELRGRERGRREAQAPARVPPGAEAPDTVCETVQCRVCNAYVAAKSGPCGRDDCPY